MRGTVRANPGNYLAHPALSGSQGLGAMSRTGWARWSEHSTTGWLAASADRAAPSSSMLRVESSVNASSTSEQGHDERLVGPDDDQAGEGEHHDRRDDQPCITVGAVVSHAGSAR